MDRAAGTGAGAALAAVAATPDGVRLRLRVQPRASRNEVVGLRGDEIRVRIAAPPVDSAANEALVRLLAEHLRVPRSAIQLVSGRSGRAKVADVVGVTAPEARERLGISP